MLLDGTWRSPGRLAEYTCRMLWGRKTSTGLSTGSNPIPLYAIGFLVCPRIFHDHPHGSASKLLPLAHHFAVSSPAPGNDEALDRELTCSRQSLRCRILPPDRTRPKWSRISWTAFLTFSLTPCRQGNCAPRKAAEAGQEWGQPRAAQAGHGVEPLEDVPARLCRADTEQTLLDLELSQSHRTLRGD